MPPSRLLFLKPRAEATEAPSATDLALRQARLMHRAAQTGPVLTALPALRRAHAAGIRPELSLSALFQVRQSLQRKHFLRTLAVEAGFADWEQWVPQLRHWPAQDLITRGLVPLSLLDAEVPYPNAWFSTAQEAQAWAQAHGGQVVQHGTQAMVLQRAA